MIASPDRFQTRSGSSPPPAIIRSCLAAILADVDGGQVVSVPVRWLAVLLGSESAEQEVEIDLTVDEVAKLFGRSPQRVREWIRAGDLDAYKLGREWRIPRSAVRGLQERLRNGNEATGSSLGRGRQVDLAAWRSL